MLKNLFQFSSLKILVVKIRRNIVKNYGLFIMDYFYNDIIENQSLIWNVNHSENKPTWLFWVLHSLLRENNNKKLRRMKKSKISQKFFRRKARTWRNQKFLQDKVRASLENSISILEWQEHVNINCEWFEKQIWSSLPKFEFSTVKQQFLSKSGLLPIYTTVFSSKLN